MCMSCGSKKTPPRQSGVKKQAAPKRTISTNPFSTFGKASVKKSFLGSKTKGGW